MDKSGSNQMYSILLIHRPCTCEFSVPEIYLQLPSQFLISTPMAANRYNQRISSCHPHVTSWTRDTIPLYLNCPTKNKCPLGSLLGTMLHAFWYSCVEILFSAMILKLTGEVQCSIAEHKKALMCLIKSSYIQPRLLPFSPLL